MGLTDESAEGSRDAERAGAASWLLIFDWTAGAVSATIVFGSPWDLTSGDAGLASVDAVAWPCACGFIENARSGATRPEPRRTSHLQWAFGSVDAVLAECSSSSLRVR